MVNAFIITGPDPKRVIVRGLGPSLALQMVLEDPVIELRASNGTLIATNDNWRSDQEAEIIATAYLRQTIWSQPSLRILFPVRTQ